MMDLIWLKEDGHAQDVQIPNYEPLIRYAIANNKYIQQI